MAAVAAKASAEPWRDRLYVPNYRVRDAAKYARISPQTVAKWHESHLTARKSREALSYLQLVEVAVVAAFRRLNVPLSEISEARSYFVRTLKSEFPFAEYRFKADGKQLIMDYEQIDGEKGKGKLLRPGQGGQLAWSDILGRLREFDYDREGVAVRWRLAESNVVIDPRVAFGSPAVGGVPTWVIRDRWMSGEGLRDIADDFALDKSLVTEGLEFEGVQPDPNRENLWVH